MLDPEADPGGLSPGLSDSESYSHIADLADGPASGEDSNTFSRKVVGRLNQITAISKKIVYWRKVLKRKKVAHQRAQGSKKKEIKEEIENIESEIQEKKAMLDILKERSGPLREKFSNEERFRRMKEQSGKQDGAGGSSSHGQHMEPASDEITAGQSAGAIKVTQGQTAGDVVNSPSQLPMEAVCEHGASRGRMVVSEQRQAVLNQAKFVFDAEGENFADDSVSKTGFKTQETFSFTKMADDVDPPESQRPASEEDAGTALGGEEAALEPSAAGSSGRGSIHDLAAMEGTSKPMDNVITGGKTAETCSSSAINMDSDFPLGRDADPMEWGNCVPDGIADSCSPLVKNDIFPAEPNILCVNTVRVPSQPDDANIQSPPVTGVRLEAEGRRGEPQVGGTLAPRSYAAATANQLQHRSSLVSKQSSSSLGGARRRNLVLLRWVGGGTPPRRDWVRSLVIKMGFQASDMYAFISPVGSGEHDLSFMKEECVDLFFERYESTWKHTEEWKGLVPKRHIRPPLMKSVTILTRNECLPAADLALWLGRYGEIQRPLVKIRDELGIWTGGWHTVLKLKTLGNVVQHVPSSAFIGRDRIVAFYAGQPKLCHRCGEKGHFAASCSVKKCSLCFELGHFARECSNVKCNLCGVFGHTYSGCPEAFHNLDREVVEDLMRLEREDGVEQPSDGVPPVPSAPEKIVESGGVPNPPVSVSSSPPPVTPVSETSVVPGSGVSGGKQGVNGGPEVKAAPVLRRSGRNVKKEGQGKSVGESKGSEGPALSAEESEWLEMKRKRGPKKKSAQKSSVPDSGLSLENMFLVLSDKEDSSEIESMDDSESHSLKRVGSSECLGRGKVKKRLPQSP